MQKKKIGLDEAVGFHGHLGPYLVLGLIAGEFALKKLKCKKYFGARVKAWGVTVKPMSCIIDGLQLSTGATYGKGNIEKLYGQHIEIEVIDCGSGNKIFLTLKNALAKDLGRLSGHKESEKFADQLYRADCEKLFDWRLVHAG